MSIFLNQDAIVKLNIMYREFLPELIVSAQQQKLMQKRLKIGLQKAMKLKIVLLAIK